MNKVSSALAVSPSVGAAMLGISRTKLYQISLNKGIPVRKVGRRSLILVTDLGRWLESQPIETSSCTQRATRN